MKGVALNALTFFGGGMDDGHGLSFIVPGDVLSLEKDQFLPFRAVSSPVADLALVALPG